MQGGYVQQPRRCNHAELVQANVFAGFWPRRKTGVCIGAPVVGRHLPWPIKLYLPLERRSKRKLRGPGSPSCPLPRPRIRQGSHWPVSSHRPIPVGGSAWYLWTRAEDATPRQWASRSGARIWAPRRICWGCRDFRLRFVRFNVLYEFIQSQEIVRRVDADLDLRRIWSKAWSTSPSSPCRLKVRSRASRILAAYGRICDGGTGLIELRVLAFDAESAQRIGQTILDEAGVMINRLTAIAREDTTRYAEDDLVAEARLKAAEEACLSV